jgi:hypothetical protein
MLTAGVWAPTVAFDMVYEDTRDPHLTLDRARVVEQLRYRPTRLLGHAVRYVELSACGVAPACFHSSSVIWHLVSTLGVFAVAWQALPPGAAVIAGIVFGLHPLHTEAVSYVSARSELVAAAGLLLALLSASFGRLSGALVGVVVAGLAKETAVMAPGLVWLWAAWACPPGYLRRWTWVLGVGGVVALAALGLYERVLTPTWAPTWGVLRMASFGLHAVDLDPARMGTELAVIGRLLAFLVWPVGLSIDHDWAPFASWSAWAGWGAVAVTAWAVAIGWRRRSWAAFAWLWTLVALAPRVVIPLTEGLHERHLYPVLIGWALCAGAWMAPSARRRGEHG